MTLSNLKRRKVRLECEIKILEYDSYWTDDNVSVLYTNLSDSIDTAIEQRLKEIKDLEFEISHIGSVYRWLS